MTDKDLDQRLVQQRKPARRRYSQHEKDMAKAMAERGESIGMIASVLGASKRTVHVWLIDWGISRKLYTTMELKQATTQARLDELTNLRQDWHSLMTVHKEIDNRIVELRKGLQSD